MSKLEKIVVSTDTETAALIEEIQNSVYDRLLDAVAESLPKTTIKASVSAVDINPILENQKKILENQKAILNALGSTSSGQYPQRIELWTKQGRCVKSIKDSGDGIYCAYISNPKEKYVYVADSNKQLYAMDGNNNLLPGIPGYKFDVSTFRDTYVIFNLQKQIVEIIE